MWNKVTSYMTLEVMPNSHLALQAKTTEGSLEGVIQQLNKHY